MYSISNRDFILQIFIDQFSILEGQIFSEDGLFNQVYSIKCEN